MSIVGLVKIIAILAGVLAAGFIVGAIIDWLKEGRP